MVSVMLSNKLYVIPTQVKVKFAMTTISERLKLVQEYFKLNQTNMAKSLGVSRSYLSEVLAGRGKPSLEMIVGIASDFSQINTDWLLTGEGPMRRTEHDETALELHTQALVQVPKYNVSAAAGAGCVSEYAQEDGLIAFDEEWLVREMGMVPSKSAVIKVQGDSMDPVLSDGDFVLIDCRDSESFAKDAIYVFNMNGDLFVKRIQHTGRKIKILSDNPQYEPWVPDTADLESLRIIGRVVLACKWL